MNKKIGFIFSYSLPIIILATFYFPDKPYTFSGFFFTYLLVPVFDQILGKDSTNVLKKDFDSLITSKYFDFLVYSHVYIHYLLVGWAAYILSTFDLNPIQIIGLILSVGIYSGTIINVAHELGHRKSYIAQFHSKLALASVFYYHFIVEHNKGHHVHVATPLDPASAHKNQTLYSFFVQTIVGSFISAWNIDVKRQEKESLKPVFYNNEVFKGLIYSLLVFSLFSLLIISFNGSHKIIAIAFLFAQALYAILSLESVNYIEHYGIRRNLLSNGRYEKVNPLHSWNANHLFSNLLLFNLQRHSDHHAYASRPYQVLRHFDISPQLPFGYPFMMIMSTIPPLWFKVMNKKLEKWEDNAFEDSHVREAINTFT